MNYNIIIIKKRIRDIDTSIYTAHVEKLMDERESIQLSTFSQRNHLWKHWKACGKLSTLLQFLAEGFCDLLLKHVKGKDVLHVFCLLGMSLSAPLL